MTCVLGNTDCAESERVTTPEFTGSEQGLLLFALDADAPVMPTDHGARTAMLTLAHRHLFRADRPGCAGRERSWVLTAEGRQVAAQLRRRRKEAAVPMAPP